MTSTTGAPRAHNVSKKKAPAPKGEPAVHILMRVRSESGQTIAAHATMIREKGVAVLGKMGDPVGPAFQDTLNRQIERGVRTYLFLTTREGWNGPYVTYRCCLRHVQAALDARTRSLVPAYYVADASKIRTWFEITRIERLTRDEMNRIVVLSSGRSIMSVIASSAVVFRVGTESSY